MEISGGDNPSCPIDASLDTRGALELGGAYLPSPYLRYVDVGADRAELTVDPTPEVIRNPPATGVHAQETTPGKDASNSVVCQCGRNFQGRTRLR